MCGIVGYVGTRPKKDVLMGGLRRLEYRGYDSAGIAVQRDGNISMVKAAGKIKELEKRARKLDLEGSVGIAHTRWATHGLPNDMNAHPHTGPSGRIALVHNGISVSAAMMLSLSCPQRHHRELPDPPSVAHRAWPHPCDGNRYRSAGFPCRRHSLRRSWTHAARVGSPGPAGGRGSFRHRGHRP